jgi:hypothetical protein
MPALWKRYECNLLRQQKMPTILKAFITDPNEIARITKNLGIPPQRAPPPLRYKLPLAA